MELVGRANKSAVVDVSTINGIIHLKKTRLMQKIIALIGLSLWLLGLSACQPTPDTAPTIKDASQSATLKQSPSAKVVRTEQNASYQNGDLIFHSSLSQQSKAIQLVTLSPYSHVGLLYQEKGIWYVYEAIRTVQRTPLERWIPRGENGHYVVKRLKDTALLTPEKLQKMKKVGQQYEGKRYDLKFEWSDEKLYCSELVWKIYEQALGIELGEKQQLKDFNYSHPLVQQKVKERYGQTLPLEQWVISPAQVFAAEQLETVFEVPVTN